LILYRIKQFIWAITANLNLQDKEFIKYYLTDYELKLFNKLPVYEKKHSIKVAYDIKKFCEKEKKYDKNFLIKLALLHDIGKICNALNVVQKCIMVILDKITAKKLSKFTKIKIIDTYYNHGLKGYYILKKYDYSYKFLYLVKNHHNNIEGNKELNILKIFDSKN
jgi:putative nucleotidyltransferase with HDIG domain